MKQIFFLFILVNSCLSLCGQSFTYYNVQGDQALVKKDYQTARIWFSEGLDSCDQYSIRKLVEIWIDQSSIRKSMLLPMRKCFDCMKTIVEDREPDMILLFSDFYKYGIGTQVDSTLANYWNEEWKRSLRTMIDDVSGNTDLFIDSTANKTPRKSLLSNHFYLFLTYTYSPTMPWGFTVGIYDKLGAYFSFRTNSESVQAAFECNNTRVLTIDIENPPYEFNRKRWHSQMITAGLMYPVVKKQFFLSVGGGYGKRDYYREIITDQSFSTGNKSEWCYNMEASYKGLTLEAGGMFVWKKLIMLSGINSTKFKDLDIYIGLGLTF